jgi:iron complex transport system substrate-binding protein
VRELILAGVRSGKSALAGRRAALLLLCWLTAAQAEVAVMDDAGNPVKLPQAAQRIVSLAPHLTELLFAAGAGDKVVAAVEFSNYPAPAKALPRIGSYAAFDLERIAALKPNLVVAWGSGNLPGPLAQLRRLGIPVFVSEPQRLEDIAPSIARLGRLAGTAGVADAAAAAFETRRMVLATRHADKREVAVFYEIWNQPLMTIGGSHLISAVMALCRGRNIFADVTQSAASIGLEAVLRADPEVIVASGMDEARPDWLNDWKRWPQLTAVKRDNLFFIPPDLLQRHTPRILDGAERLCAALDTARQRGAQLGK